MSINHNYDNIHVHSSVLCSQIVTLNGIGNKRLNTIIDIAYNIYVLIVYRDFVVIFLHPLLAYFFVLTHV